MLFDSSISIWYPRHFFLKIEIRVVTPVSCGKTFLCSSKRLTMKVRIALLFLLLCTSLNAQITPPFFDAFEGVQPEWSHYAILGEDKWELGSSTCPDALDPSSGTNAWSSNLDGSYGTQSIYCLESPVFDFSADDVPRSLTFTQQRDFSINPENKDGGQVEYSTDGGENWQVLNPIKKRNWYAGIFDNGELLVTGFTGSENEYTISSAGLDELIGEPMVSFRFCLYSTGENTVSNCGWMIDDFEIRDQQFNVSGQTGTTQIASKFVPEVQITVPFECEQDLDYSTEYSLTYYFSEDSILDEDDLLIDQVQANAAEGVTPQPYTVNLQNLPELYVGEYYILQEVESQGIVPETNSLDNVSHSLIRIDSTYSAGYFDDFDSGQEMWATGLNEPETDIVWHFGTGFRHHVDGAHSGQNAWSTSHHFPTSAVQNHYVETPYLDLDNSEELFLSFWYKSHFESRDFLYYSTDNAIDFEPWQSLPASENDDWQHLNIGLEDLESCRFAKIRFYYENNSDDYDGLIIDDVYVGPAKPDLSIEDRNLLRFGKSTDTDFSLNFKLANSGKVEATEVHVQFYWSTDAEWDVFDTLLGQHECDLDAESLSEEVFEFEKPNQQEGQYYILYQIDEQGEVDEMRESNNSGSFLFQQMEAESPPYANGFESNQEEWYHESSLGEDPWTIDLPLSNFYDGAFEGERAYITGQELTCNEGSRTHLYTPVFDLSEIDNPIMEFDLLLEFDDVYETHAESAANFSYSTDGGASWNLLETNLSSQKQWLSNWQYDGVSGEDQRIGSQRSDLLFDLHEPVLPDVTVYQGRDNARTTHYILDLAEFADQTTIRFRLNFATPIVSYDIETENLKIAGCMLDNFQIREAYSDLYVDYEKSLQLGTNTSLIRLEMKVKNQGNFETDNFDIDFYLSTDTILDLGDVLIDTKEMAGILPDRYGYLNTSLFVGNDLDDHNYLLYVLDSGETIVESQEMNNIGNWPLDVSVLNSYPYINDFNADVIDGWKPYTSDFEEEMGLQHRFRHQTAPGEDVSTSLRRSLEWFTDQIDTYCADQTSRPIWYLESPSFDLSEQDQVFVNFNLYSVSASEATEGYSDGSNLEYSVDGGLSWKVLGYANDGTGTNWYDSNNMDFFSGEHGWTGVRDFYEPVNYNASPILANEENVMFRCKFSSNFTPDDDCNTRQGMRLDNFVLQTDGPTFVDYVAASDCPTIDLTDLSGPNFSINFQITNTGSQVSGEAITKFYWSKDEVLDETDFHASDFRQLNIGPQQSINFYHLLPTPDSSCDSLLYLLYEVDAALPGRPNGVAIEPDEENNFGCFKVLLNSQAASASADIDVANIPNLCYGEPATLSVDQGYVYEWSTGEESAEILVFAPGTYWLKMYNEFGCYLGTDTVNVEYEFLPDFELNEGLPIGICEGEEITLDASIEDPTSYVWSNGDETPTTVIDEEGPYSVAVTNLFGCTTTREFYVTVDNPAQLGVQVQGDLPMCEGDSIRLISNQMLGNVWSTGEIANEIVVTSGGDYQLQHENFCGQTFTGVNLSSFAVPDTSITIIGSVNFCEGDFVTLQAMPDYEYFWSNGEDSQSVTIDETTVVDLTITSENGCSLTSSPIVVQRQPLPNAFIEATAGTKLCENGELFLSGPVNTTNVWSTGDEGPGLVVTEPGDYSLIAYTEFSCSDTSEVVSIQEVPSPAIPQIAVSDNVLSTDADAMSYQWYYNGLPIFEAEGQSLSVSLTGEYSLIVSNEDECTTSSEVVPYGFDTAIEDQTEASIFLYPNPTINQSVLEISDLGGKVSSIQILDLAGRELAILPGAQKLILDAEKLKLVKGAYILKISSKEKSIFAKWIVSP